MRIVKAGLTHVGSLLPLFDAYRAFYKKELSTEKARAFLSENLRTARSTIFIAENDNAEVIGFTQLYPRVSSLSMAPYVYISDLYVDELHRGLGASKLLMKQAEEFAISIGATSLQLETAHSNVRAQCLYASLGYEQDMDYRTYSLSLPAGSSAVFQHDASTCQQPILS